MTIIFTVGFSGFCLAFIPFFSNSKQLNELTNEVKEINQKMYHLENIQNELNTKLDFSEQIFKVNDEDLLKCFNSEFVELKDEIMKINSKIGQEQ